MANRPAVAGDAAALIVLTPTHAQPQAQRGATSYAPVDIKGAFPSIMERYKVPGVRRLAVVAIGWRHRPVEAPGRALPASRSGLHRD